MTNEDIIEEQNAYYMAGYPSRRVTARPVEKIKKNCLCCGKEMELELHEERDFCDRCFPVVCREVFNKANDGMTVEEVKEVIRKNLENAEPEKDLRR